MSTMIAPVRLRGILRAGDRGFHLDSEDGQVWRIEGAEPYASLAGQPVVIEAYRRASGALELLWAGPAA
ncbi:hypothetical protein GGR43_004335 [Sphingobium jiangsuense]|uniref:Uncharacterized protein n=1 Tax=Sphingobium jiangsuense TaxID=870476 RepID=A0A7W6FS04_9SPHN|nr:DUF5818 domain-containing protein [Sphingobium jiangsuense]MBB3928590.1 hypothetical protein [Sphingobium jiangsuense]